jgi:hypothetical protein
VCLFGVLSHFNYLEDARNHKPETQNNIGDNIKMDLTVRVRGCDVGRQMNVAQDRMQYGRGTAVVRAVYFVISKTGPE